MRIRAPFAGAFVVLCLLSAYLGFASLQISLVNDKVVHFITFFILTTCFYWILDTSRRRNLNFTLIVCTLILGFGSEFVQGFLPNGRDFDPYDILANLVGSLSALGLSSWYHKRMLERKRKAKNYEAIPGEDEDGNVVGDVELGEAGFGPQETGVTPGPSLEEEVDNWDENVEDNWDEDDVPPPSSDGADAGKAEPGTAVAAEDGPEEVVKKRND